MKAVVVYISHFIELPFIVLRLEKDSYESERSHRITNLTMMIQQFSSKIGNKTFDKDHGLLVILFFFSPTSCETYYEPSQYNSETIKLIRTSS